MIEQALECSEIDTAISAKGGVTSAGMTPESFGGWLIIDSFLRVAEGSRSSAQRICLSTYCPPVDIMPACQ
jgi:hypothetical protein